MLNDFRVQTIVWDKAIDRIYETVRASEGDSNGRKLRVQILDRGKYVDLGGTSLSLAWKTPEEDAKGLDAFELVDSETGTFEIYYTTEMLGNVGRLSATLVLVDSVGRIESSPFAISVIESNVDDDMVQSENSFTALTQALITVSRYDSRISNLQSTKADRSYVDSENRKVNRKVDDEVEKLDEIDREITARLAHNERVKIGGGVKGSLADFDEETLNFIHDGTGGPIEVGSRPEDYSVGPKQTTFIKVSSNLVNANDGQVGYRTNLSDGMLESHNQFMVSDFIPVKRNKKYTIYGIERYSLYNNSKNHISSEMWNYASDVVTITTTENTRFIRVSYRQPEYNSVYNEVRLNEGGELLPYESFYKPIFDKNKVEIEFDKIKPEDTTFINLSTNIVNKEGAVYGQTVALGRDELEERPDFNTTDYINVEPFEELTVKGARRISYYDKNKNYQSSQEPNWGQDVISVVGNSYIRISTDIGRWEKLQLNVGDVDLPYEDYGSYLDSNIMVKADKNKVEIEFDKIKPEDTTFINPSTNILNKEGAVYGHTVPLGRDGLDVRADFNTTDYINVEPFEELTVKGARRISFFDKDKNYQSSLEPNWGKDVISVVGNSYVRISTDTGRWGTLQLNVGDVDLPYEEIGMYLDSNIIIDGDSIRGSNNGGSINLQSDVYTSPLLEGGTPDTSAEVIALFDEFVDGEYVTKKIWGQDDFGNDLVSYKASKPNMETTTGLEPIRFGFSAGMHGNERNTVVGLYHFLKDFIENKDKNFTFMKVQSLVEIHYFPQVNPSGWNNNTRHNGNDVNLNRNFTTNWQVREGVGGTGPASEPETQAVEAWLSESQLDYYFDIHTTVAVDDSWIAVAEQEDEAVEGKKLIEDYYKTRSFLSNWWGEREDIDFPKNTMMGYVRTYNPIAQGYHHAFVSEGANSLILELADRYSPDVTSRGPVTNTFSAETIGNFFLQILKRNDVF